MGRTRAICQERRCSMSFDKDEVLAKIGKRVQLHDYEDVTAIIAFSEDVPAGTAGQILHANLVHRFRHPEYEPADLYDVVIEWDALDRRIDMFGERDYKLFITEL